MGGGGSGKSQTENTGQYPPEFQPLAKSAVEQIQAFQQMLPLTSFAPYQPQGVAGLSPVEQFGINELVMRTPYLPEGVGQAYRMADEQANMPETEGARRAQQALDRYLQPRFPSTPPQYQGQPALPKGTSFQMPETAFPGLTKQAVENARLGGSAPAQPPAAAPGGGGIANQPTPVMGGGPPPAMGPMVPPQQPQQPTTALSITDVHRQTLAQDPIALDWYDFYIGRGWPPSEAYNGALQHAGRDVSPAMMNLAGSGGYDSGGGGGDEGAGQGP